MPVVATRVASTPPDHHDGEHHVFARLSAPERDYVRGLRKRERVALTRALEPRKRGRENQSAPLRIRVLQSALPAPVRLAIFDKLQAGACPKYLDWVTKALQLPLDVRAPAVDPVHMPVGACVARARAWRASGQSVLAVCARCLLIRVLICTRGGPPRASRHLLVGTRRLFVSWSCSRIRLTVRCDTGARSMPRLRAL